MKNKNLSILVECAVMVSLAFVLSLIKIWEMPFGGSITLFSMLPICLISLRHGVKWGLGAGFVYSGLQALVSGAVGWGLTPMVLIICFLFDYIIAFTVLGLSGIFGNGGIKRQVSGIVLACVLRFLCHYISGVTIWSSSALDAGFNNPYIYSLLYNGAYMLPEMIFTCIGAVLILDKFKLKH
ncbi:MAG: energy-coupled thiamine transporter ThiT [Clostridia bacterium]|nr:energy-coupled thiamine transporter ThiT [Clostridia bacterium]